MTPSSPQTHASQALQNRRTSPCMEQIPSPSKIERRQPLDTRARDGNKTVDRDLEDVERLTSMPEREKNAIRQVEDSAPPTLLSSKVRRQAMRKRRAATEISTNDKASSTRHKKTKAAQLNSNLIDDLQSVIGSSSAMTECIIRPIGAEDLEVAIKDCTQLFTESHGVPFVIKVTHWLRADTLNLVVWNALKDKELKEAFVGSLE